MPKMLGMGILVEICGMMMGIRGVLENAALAKQYKAYFLFLWVSIPSMYLYRNPSPESFESGNSCYDGIDNDFDKSVDREDSGCQ